MVNFSTVRTDFHMCGIFSYFKNPLTSLLLFINDARIGWAKASRGLS